MDGFNGKRVLKEYENEEVQKALDVVLKVSEENCRMAIEATKELREFVYTNDVDHLVKAATLVDEYTKRGKEMDESPEGIIFGLLTMRYL